MDKEEILEKNIDKTMGFFQYVFNFDDDNKNLMLNMSQYVLMAVIPVVVVLKLIKEYVPEEDDTKHSLEIGLEVGLQLLAIFFGVWFIDRAIRYLPTYTGTSYHRFNEINFVIPVLFILTTMQTKLGAKINILVDRLMALWYGENSPPAPKRGVKVRQPLAGIHQASRGDTLDNAMIPPPSQNMNMNAGNTTLIDNLPNLNNSGQNPNAQYGTDVMNLAMMDDMEPMAANGLVGGAFGSGW